MKIKSHIICGSVANGASSGPTRIALYTLSVAGGRDEWTEQAKSRSKDPGEFGDG